jgi:hypothetical protein
MNNVKKYNFWESTGIAKPKEQPKQELIKAEVEKLKEEMNTPAPNSSTAPEILKEEDVADKTRTVIEILQKEKFGNEGQRRKFIDLITSLFGINDKDSRKFIKMLGDAATGVANKMLVADEPEEEVEEVVEVEEAPTPKIHDEFVSDAIGGEHFESTANKLDNDKALLEKIQGYEQQILSERKTKKVRNTPFGEEVDEYKFNK